VAGQRQPAEVIALKIGIPLKGGDDTIGAIGVSGSTTDGDENCAEVGAAKIADQVRSHARTPPSFASSDRLGFVRARPFAVAGGNEVLAAGVPQNLIRAPPSGSRQRPNAVLKPVCAFYANQLCWSHDSSVTRALLLPH
jgi:hypothetical protein